MSAFDQFRQVIANRHDYAQEWRARNGGKVVGYICTYSPEELIFAANALPVRVLGSHEPENVTSPYLYGMFCPYCRDCLAQGLQGKYSYLDGIIHGYCCIHIRQTFDSWVRHVPTPFTHFVYVADHLESWAAARHLAGELARFKTHLEEWTGQAISSQALYDAINIFNLNRHLLTELYSLQKENSPRLSGAEILEAVLAGQLMDKREHNELLQAAIAEGQQRKVSADPRARLMLIASEMDDADFVRMIESLGAVIVVDDNCVGTRYFMGDINPDSDPLAAIANRYAQAKPLCPVKDISTRFRKRIPHILSLAQDYKVQGVVFAKNKFCDPHEYDIPAIIAALKEKGMPSLTLECDFLNPIGQFRTRVEAFLEVLRLESI